MGTATYTPPNWLNTTALITQMVPVWVQLIESLVLAFKRNNPAATVSGTDKRQAAVSAIANSVGVSTDLHPAIGAVVDAQVAKNNQDGTFTH